MAHDHFPVEASPLAGPPLPRIVRILPPGPGAPVPADRIALVYDARLVRRKRLVTEGGRAILADFPRATELLGGATLELDDGTAVAIVAAPEPLYEVRGPLARLAWHIGNRHTPCEIGPETLRIARDPVLAGMLQGLGAELRELEAPFRPEGGAYGTGRTFGHAHD